MVARTNCAFQSEISPSGHVRRVKYTKAVLEPIVQNSFSIADILRKLGITNYSGGMSNLISRRIKLYELDTSHFTGNSGYAHRGGKNKTAWTDLLITKIEDSPRTSGTRLRNALIESGMEYRCNSCGISPHWNNQVLTLEVDHINGKRWDDARDNLRFVCPNCHSQQATSKGGRRSARPLAVRICPVCTIEFKTKCSSRKIFCGRSCAAGQVKHSKIRPPIDELRVHLLHCTTAEVARIYKVSWGAVKKWKILYKL